MRDRRSAWLLAALLPCLAALGVRLVGLQQIFVGPEVRLIDGDSHYHAWRMIQAREQFPRLPPMRDPLINYPEGYLQHWPPLLDYVGGGLARLGGVAPDGEDVARLGTLLVVLLGCLAPLLVVRLLRRLTTPAWAALGATLAALWPMLIEYCRVGRIDHHVLEPLLTGLAVLCYLASCRAADARRRWQAAAGCGLVLALAVWGFPTGLLSCALLGAGMLLHQLVRGGPPVAAVAGAIAALLAAPLCFADPAYRGSWALHWPSRFHLALLATIALAALWIRALRPTAGGHRRWLRGALLLAGLAGLGALLLALLARGGGLEVARGFGGRGGLWEFIVEQRPLFALPAAHVVLLVTHAGLALPLLIALALAAPREPAAGDEVRLLAGWCGACLLLGVLQLRFLPWGLTLGAPLAALGAAEASRRLAALLGARAARAPWLAPAAVTLLMLALSWPAVGYLAEGKSMPRVAQQNVARAARWLRRRPIPETPAVLALLGAGHPLVHLGRAPVVGSTLVAPNTEPANHDAVEAMITADLERARAIVAARRAGRVLATALRPLTYAHLRRYLEPGAPLPATALGSGLRRSLVTRLMQDSGSGATDDGGRLPAVSWLQHEWESEPGPPQETAQLFRVVRGARLAGRARPGALVELRLRLLTNRGRRLVYRDAVRADGAGSYVLRLPYATGPAIAPPRPETTTAVGPAVVLVEGRARAVTVTRTAVLEGQLVLLPTPVLSGAVP